MQTPREDYLVWHIIGIILQQYGLDYSHPCRIQIMDIVRKHNTFTEYFKNLREKGYEVHDE